jgi:dUTP pyrophosphatase
MTYSGLLVEIQRLPHGYGLPLPQYWSAHAAAMDLHAAVERRIQVPAGELFMVPCGFALAVPTGFEAQIRPRSGIATKHRVIVPNSPGTIDSDYRGEIHVALLNLGTMPFLVERGARVAQMVIAPVSRVEWREVQGLPATERGSGGFGHTGA